MEILWKQVHVHVSARATNPSYQMRAEIMLFNWLRVLVDRFNVSLHICHIFVNITSFKITLFLKPKWESMLLGCLIFFAFFSQK